MIGKENGVFKTAHSAAWPPALCKWTAEAILTSFLQECLGGGEPCSGREDKKRSPDEGGQEAAKKRQKVQHEKEMKSEVDPMNPIFPGGRGPPPLLQMEGLGGTIS